jgi:hypothetical protein
MATQTLCITRDSEIKNLTQLQTLQHIESEEIIKPEYKCTPKV